MNDNDIMVTILCTTYNHEKFVRDAIEGVLKQKTNFRFELLIHDDASTDKTTEIISEYVDQYPKIIRTIFQKENQMQRGCCIYPTFLFPEIKGKYVALCEGDDYWIDENKLQCQIDFMEAHSDYSMCMHNAIKLNYETGEKKLLDTFEEDGSYTQEKQILSGLGTDFPAFASYVLRAEFLNEIPEFFVKSQVVDYPIRQYYACKGKVYYFKRPMSVYRVATPQSYMKNIGENQINYNNYTLSMIRFFEEFDNYTDYKFHNLLECKIMSDYFGFCLSIKQNEGERKATENGLNMSMIHECYQLLSEDYLDESVQKLYEKTNQLFIYGTSRIAPICKKQLEKHGIEFQGFVVSDGQMKREALENKKVFYLSEVMRNYSNPGFILAVQPINMTQITKVLKDCNFRNYCTPYKI